MINIGTIMKIYKNEVLVMTIDFELVRVKRNPEMFQGQQVSFRKSDVIRPEVRKIKLILSSGVAAVLMFAFISFSIIQNTSLSTENTSYAFIDMDINPSIEFLIDDTNIVQKVLPLNYDAENLTKVLTLKNLTVKEAVKKVIDRSQKTGILNSNKNDVIMISASLNPKNSDYKARRDKAELKLNQLLASLKAMDDIEFNKEYTIKVVKVEPEIKKQALKNGLSAGRQLIFEKAQTEGIGLTLDEAKTGSLSVLMKKVGIDEQNTEKEPSSSPAVQSPEKEPLSSPVAQSPEKVTATVKPTFEKETATPLKMSKPTPSPVSNSIRPTDAKMPNSSAGSIKIQYYNISKKVSDVIQINSVFNVVNTGNKTINLKDVTIRYYYTIDGEKPQFLDCWAQVDKSNITYRFVKMSKPVKKADYYLELGFKSGQLTPKKDTIFVTWFNKDDWSIYKQDDDFSYNSSSIEELYDWNYVTGYISGVLKWGIEPSH